jgi:hypothetical protein
MTTTRNRNRVLYHTIDALKGASSTVMLAMDTLVELGIPREEVDRYAAVGCDEGRDDHIHMGISSLWTLAEQEVHDVR